MLSYRHGYHAGSPADVLKHAVFVFSLRHALTEPTPLYVLDTHAGAGLYDVTSPMAEKLGEYRRGILPALRTPSPRPELVTPLLDLVAAMNPGRRLTTYPGSAALAAMMLRDTDRLELIELHPTEIEALTRRAAGDPRIRVRHGDASELLPRCLPPRERRGIVFIDPSYEIKTDYDALSEMLIQAYRRFARGTYLLWYPVIERERTDYLVESIARSGMSKVLQIELGLLPDGAARGMTGSGLLVLNPPCPLAQCTAEALPWLARAFGAQGPQTLRWLAGE